MPRKTKCQCGRVIIVSVRAAESAITCPKCGEQVDFAPTKQDARPSSSPSHSADDLPDSPPKADSAPPPVIRAPVKLDSSPTSQTTSEPPAGKQDEAPAKSSKRKRGKRGRKKRRQAATDAPVAASAPEAAEPVPPPLPTTVTPPPVQPPPVQKTPQQPAPAQPTPPQNSPAAKPVSSQLSEADLADAALADWNATSTETPALERSPTDSNQHRVQSKPDSSAANNAGKTERKSKQNSKRQQSDLANQRATANKSQASQQTARDTSANDTTSTQGKIQETPARPDDSLKEEKRKPAEDTVKATQAANARKSPSSASPSGAPVDTAASESKSKRKNKKRRRKGQAKSAPENPAAENPAADLATSDSEKSEAAAAKTAVEESKKAELGPLSDLVIPASSTDSQLPEIKTDAPAVPTPPPKAKPKKKPTAEDPMRLEDAPPVQTGEAVIYGVEHDADRVAACYMIGAAMVLTAIFGAAPALYQTGVYFMSVEPTRLEAWALLLVAVGGIQFAYACYLMQAPDWSTAQVTAYFMAGLATAYAAALGAIAFSSPLGGVVRFLQIFAYHGDSRASGWCFIMLMLTGCIAYFGGRFAWRWRQEETEIEL